jgi:hypothetical protein
MASESITPRTGADHPTAKLAAKKQLQGVIGFVSIL